MEVLDELIILCRLTISTLGRVTPDMRLIDVHGLPHDLTERQVRSGLNIYHIILEKNGKI